jgi:hypothetical protein
MHKYLRSIGFSNLTDNQALEALLERAVNEKYKTDMMFAGNGTIVEQYQLPVAPSMGITVVGERDNKGVFHRSYYFPYMRSYDGTLTREGTVERHLEKETYAGVLEDFRAGITLIFYVTNSVQLRELHQMMIRVDARQAFLTGLSTEGMILLPIEKNEEDDEIKKRRRREQKKLYEAARQGDPEAIETLTETDLNIMNEVQHRIVQEDLYSLVESSFMPTGVECDMYQILGEIVGMRVKSNVYTHENIVDLKINCNDCIFHVAINEADLHGVPAIGRRFKGKIWMQGELEVIEEKSDDKTASEKEHDE